MTKKQEKITCKCPVCKTDFDITEVVTPIKQQAINDFMEKILDYKKNDKI